MQIKYKRKLVLLANGIVKPLKGFIMAIVEVLLYSKDK